jgi:hypothetical protein
MLTSSDDSSSTFLLCGVCSKASYGFALSEKNNANPHAKIPLFSFCATGDGQPLFYLKKFKRMIYK